MEKVCYNCGMRKVLIAGGAGFIPSHICKRLVDQGNFIYCLDNTSTGSKENIEPLLSKKNFKYVQGDIREKSVLDQFSDEKIDEIYHLASPASVTYIMEHPVEVSTVNSIGTFNLLELTRRNNSRILFASSSEVYGDPKEHPQKESYWGNVNSIGVRSGYDEGKRFGEALCMAFRREKNIDVKIVRIFNTYGPNSSPNDSRVVPRFITCALKNEPIPVHGDGTQTRSFCYVSDMVDGITKMMESDKTGPINVGNPDEYKIIDLAKRILEMTGSSSEITYVDRPQDDPSVRRPDITKARELISWQPKVTLQEGLRLTIDYFKKILPQSL